MFTKSCDICGYEEEEGEYPDEFFSFRYLTTKNRWMVPDNSDSESDEHSGYICCPRDVADDVDDVEEEFHEGV